MPFLNAILKETLRFHPISYNIINEQTIPKGTYIISSIAGYNRNKVVFGADAHTFNPERRLDSDVKRNAKALPSCGCELQALIVEILDKSELSLTEDWIRTVWRESCGVMMPTLEGEVEKGAQLPLRVKTAAR
ncbi:hypothetical protein ARMGADRAFT_1054374 [Armillaria gallica]|uniref:Cytochrome P450 n=1 Tax=Armillaria gallica TaxID=47427 RepID=A0A2H3D6Z6_ARMGA|nr:hypothetical protein ARMGADRAFT_1054374 [Armillaria gallica]